MMTRKDYKALARIIREAAPSDAWSSDQKTAMSAGIEYIARRVAEYLQADNPRFNAERFRQAIETGKGL